jgi:hypothetical protein
MSLTLSARNTVLPTLFAGTVYIALHNGNPSDSATANELSGGGYARQPATFNVDSGTGTAILGAGLTFTVGSSVTLTHISMWSAATGGAAFNRQPLTAPVQVTSGTFTIAAGDITTGGNV